MKSPNLIENMTRLAPPPDREAIEKELHNLVYGDLSAIARLLQKDQSQVNKEFNPYDTDRVSIVYQMIMRLWAFDALNDRYAAETLNIILRERSKWLPASRSGCSPAKLTGNISQEFGEFIECELAGKSYDVRIKEIMDVIAAAEKKKSDIIAEKNEQHFGELREA